MKQILRISAALTMMVMVAACGNGRKEDKAALGDKKTELAKLKDDQAKLAERIQKLENEIAKADPEAAKEKTAKLVSLLTVTNQDFEHYIELQGKIDAENISYVAPRGAPGQVKAIYIKHGDMVKSGQLLLKLDDAVIRQNITAAKQGLEQIKTQLSFAKNLYQRQKNLWDQNIGTEVQVISAKNNVDALENQLKTAEENVKTAQEQWATTNVYAEVGGIVDQLNVKVGEMFQGYSGSTPQIVIINTSNLKVVTDIPENYLTRVHKGSAVKVIVPDLNNKEFKTTISLVSQAININSRGFIAEAKIPYEASLKPNQIAIMRILDYSAKSVIAIPVNTVQTDEQGKYIYIAVKQNDKVIARKKHIIVGELSGQLIEVKSGITSGEQLVTEGYQNIYDGQFLKTDK
ncbi:MAG: efflux RND transporter periplasmic adaptor subunit [Sphingobacteriales bacterium]